MWFRDNVSPSNIHRKSRKKSISIRRVLFKYWYDFETMSHPQTSSSNHIRNQSVWTEFYWSIQVTSRQCFTIEISSSNHIKNNHPGQNSVKVLRWDEDNVSRSNIGIKSHYKAIPPKSSLLKYSVKFKTMIHHQTSFSNHIANRSVWPESRSDIGVSCKRCWLIDHCIQISSQINQYQESSVEVLTWLTGNVSSTNILFKSHFNSISIRRVLLNYSRHLGKSIHHGASSSKHIRPVSI